MNPRTQVIIYDASGHPVTVASLGAGVYALDVNLAGASVPIVVSGAVTIADGADVTEGLIADAAVQDAVGTVNAHVRGINKTLLAGIPGTVVDGGDVTLGAIADAAVGDASGTVNAHLRGINAALNLLVSYLAPKAILKAVGNVNSNTSIVAAVTSKRIKVVFASLRSSYSAGAIIPILTDGNGGTTIFQDLEQALSGSVSGSVNPTLPFGAGTSAGTALYLNPNGQTVYYTVYYHADDAT